MSVLTSAGPYAERINKVHLTQPSFRTLTAPRSTTARGLISSDPVQTDRFSLISKDYSYTYWPGAQIPSIHEVHKRHFVDSALTMSPRIMNSGFTDARDINCQWVHCEKQTRLLINLRGSSTHTEKPKVRLTRVEKMCTVKLKVI